VTFALTLPLSTASLTALAVLVLAVVGLLVAERRDDRAMVWVMKPVASLAFCALAVARGALETAYGRAVLVALVLSLAGDVLLIPKKKGPFLAGLFAFLGGHVAYAVAFVLRGVDPTAALVAAGPIVVALVVVARWLLPKVERGMRRPVVGYMLVISTMVALSVGAVRDGATALVLVAAVVFYASDLSVALDRFVRRAFVNRAWGLPAYFGAQALFALTVV
jgi:uncharacterized membrane protein YhhN